MVQRFSWDFLLANCSYRPPFTAPTDLEDSLTSMSLRSSDPQPSSLELPSDDEGEREGKMAEGTTAAGNSEDPDENKSEYLLPPPLFPAKGSAASSPNSSPPVHSAAETNLLAQASYFAAQGTHVAHHKVGKVARRVIIRLAKVLRNEPFSLEIVHEVVSRCHRTQAEGLLDRVLTAREKAADSERPGGKKRAAERKNEARRNQKYTPFPETQARKESPVPRATPERGGGASPGGVASDDSYRSAVSDLSVEEKGEREDRRPEGASSSGGSSDSKSGEKGATGVGLVKLPK